MFVMKKAASYRWPVKFESPKSGGGFETSTLDIDFKRLSNSRIREVVSDEKAENGSFCKEIVVGWAGIKDDQGTDIPFSDTALDELLEVPGMAIAIVNAYLESLSGAKRKN